MEGWGEFFVAEVGAAAALAGLLVVAISINIEKIMAMPTLPPRAAQTLIIVTAALVIGSLGLFPRQPIQAYGWEAVATGLVIGLTGLLEVRNLFVRRSATDPLFWSLYPLVLVIVTALPPLVGGILLIGSDDAGMYWVGAGIIISFLTTLQGGWVLLVEILR
jgi:modulator of FtsH protease